MRRITWLRGALEKIDDALTDVPPEDGLSGNDRALSDTARVLWRGEEDMADFRSVYEISLGSDEPDQAKLNFEPVFQLAPEMESAVPKLGSDQEEEIARDVLLRGMDALGWYSSYHVRGGQWGVYIKVSGLLYLVQKAFSGLDLEPIARIQLAFRAILDHELFHFATDYAVGQTELALVHAWWIPFKTNKGDMTPPPYPIEEQLANAYMLRRFRTGRKVRGKQEALRLFTEQQPAGYQDADQIKSGDWPDKLAQLASEYGQHWAADHDEEALFDAETAYDWEAQFPMRPAVDWRYCPIHLVDDSRRFGLPEGWLEPFSRLEQVVESAVFKKQLAQLSDVLQKGWKRARQKLLTGITSGCDFKPWPRGGADTWSCRVGDNFRVHLRHDRVGGFWEAVAIGSHKAMGHG